MKHDKFCAWSEPDMKPLNSPTCMACDVFAQVRADERKKLSDKLNDLPSLVVNDEIILSLDDFASLVESGEQE